MCDARYLLPGLPVVVGFSMGGLVAATYTARYPASVAALCLIDACGFAAPPLPISCLPAYLCHGIYKVTVLTQFSIHVRQQSL